MSDAENTPSVPSADVLDDYLSSLYNTAVQPGSFMGINKLYTAVKRENIYTVTYQQIKDWLETNRTYSLYKRVRRVKRRPRVVVAGIDDQFDADLADLSAPDYVEHNNGVRFLLVVIDIFTRYLWVRPLKNKYSDTVVKAFKAIFKKSKRRPRRIRSDRGSEFTAKTSQDYFKSENIVQIFTGNEVQANYVERVIQTLKTKLFRYMATNDTRRYIDVLPDIVKSYNSTYHTGIGAVPKDIDKSDERRLWWNMYLTKEKYNPQEAKRRQQRGLQLFAFNVGDKVRINLLKKAFKREYDQKWSGEVYLIRRRFVRDRLPMYLLQDYAGEALKGSFYQNELQRVQIPNDSLFVVDSILDRKQEKGVTKVKVHFKDWPARFDRWVRETDLVDTLDGEQTYSISPPALLTTAPLGTSS